MVLREGSRMWDLMFYEREGGGEWKGDFVDRFIDRAVHVFEGIDITLFGCKILVPKGMKIM